MIDELCMCGHTEKAHTLSHAYHPDLIICTVCKFYPKALHEFKLDNLRLVEVLAKEKGLI